MTSCSSPAPPPYMPMEIYPPSYTQKGTPHTNRRGSRCTKSESWTSRHSNIDDDDFLANVAAIRLLTGCTMMLSGHVVSSSHRSIDIYSGDDDDDPALALYMFSTSSVPPRRDARFTARFQARRYALQTIPGNGIDGHISCPSDESARGFAKAYSGSKTLSSQDQVGSKEFDWTLTTIDEALEQNSGRRRSRRLHTSEVVRKDKPEVDENGNMVDSTGEVSAPLAAWKYSQYQDLSQRSGVLYPSPVLSEMACSTQSASEVRLSTSPPQIPSAIPVDVCLLTELTQSHTPRRSTLEDRSHMSFDNSLKDKIAGKFRTHKRSLRYDMSGDTIPSRRKRRDARYSSVHMSTAESSPLFNTPASFYRGEDPNPLSHIQADPGGSFVNPLAATSIEVATNQLDRLASRAEGTSIKRRAVDERPESLNISEEPSAQNMRSATPDVKSFFISATPTELISTNLASAGVNPDSPTVTPQNTPISGVGTPRDNITGALHALRRYRRRKITSKLSEIYTYEGIPEASEDEAFLSASTPAYKPSPSGTDSRNGPSGRWFASPRSSCGHAGDLQEGVTLEAKNEPVNQPVGMALLTKDNPPKAIQSHKMSPRSNTCSVHVESAEPLRQCPGLEITGGPGHQFLSPGLRPFLRSTSSYPSLSGVSRVDIVSLEGGSRT